mgnify:CR=1 FL=1
MHNHLLISGPKRRTKFLKKLLPTYLNYSENNIIVRTQKSNSLRLQQSTDFNSGHFTVTLDDINCKN